MFGSCFKTLAIIPASVYETNIAPRRLKLGLTPKIRMLRFVIINSVLFNNKMCLDLVLER